MTMYCRNAVAEQYWILCHFLSCCKSNDISQA